MITTPLILLDKFKHLIKESDNQIEILYGGRASGKSTTIAKLLICDCLRKDNFLCGLIRDNISDIKYSSYQQLKNQIIELEIEDLFEFKLFPLSIVCKSNKNKFVCFDLKNPSRFNFSSYWITETLEKESDFNKIYIKDKNVKLYWDFNSPLVIDKMTGEINWIYKRFFSEHKNILDFSSISNGVKYRVTHSDYKDNKFLSEEVIKNIELSRDKSLFVL